MRWQVERQLDLARPYMDEAQPRWAQHALDGLPFTHVRHAASCSAKRSWPRTRRSATGGGTPSEKARGGRLGLKQKGLGLALLEGYTCGILWRCPSNDAWKIWQAFAWIARARSIYTAWGGLLALGPLGWRLRPKPAVVGGRSTTSRLVLSS